MDTLEIQNLVFPDGLTALTLWQTWKPQPASLNLSLTLDPGFASAASKDALDANTVHYGNLSKRIRLTGCPKLPMAIMSIEYDVREMARREDESTRLGNWRLEVMLPKAGTVAETVVVGSFWRGEALKGRWIEWKDLNLRVLIGVNEIERTGRQPLGLELGLWCEGDGNGMLGRLMEGFGIEEKLIEVRSRLAGRQLDETTADANMNADRS